MSASVISMEDWQREKFIHWAVAFTLAALESMPAAERKKAERRMLKMIEANG